MGCLRMNQSKQGVVRHFLILFSYYSLIFVHEIHEFNNNIISFFLPIGKENKLA